ncbi:hypothetical protein [Streptomyces sp. NBC_00996]|uniref:hypothetical protein n=1 Tax=Streptomyces sp. NBC_00996 TaxID=2903710 RepID=UPI0038702688|nr:hypothetical protein OG390_02820 [Streptomyces sp. NBC_00996]
MRRANVHEAVLVMHPDADLQAPGAAITVELCLRVGRLVMAPPSAGWPIAR